MEEKRWLGHLALWRNSPFRLGLAGRCSRSRSNIHKVRFEYPLWTAMVSSRARKPPEDGQAEGSPIFPYRSAITLLDFWVFGSY